MQRGETRRLRDRAHGTGQSAWKTIHTICIAGLSLLPDEKIKEVQAKLKQKEPGKTKSHTDQTR